MSNWRLPLFTTLVALAITLTGCGSDDVSTTEASESGPTVEDISAPISEQDIAAARDVFDAGKERWERFEPFAYTMSIGVQTISELRISFDVAGNVVSEEVVRGEPGEWDIDSLPRSVDDVFAVVDDMLRRFEDGRSSVPDEGECGHHFNARFDRDWGVPSYYDSLGPCDDGVGIFVAITRDSSDGESGPDAAAAPVLEAEGDEVKSAWQTFVEKSQQLDLIDLSDIDGFEPFNKAWRLSDGRYLARGRWNGDDPIAGWYQRNPSSVAPGEEVPDPIQTELPPIRLFVIDAESSKVTPISHVPEVRPFNTAVSVGESADVVLDVVFVAEEAAVAYTSGFSGAGYDEAYELHTVLLPLS